ncbi:VanZ family protein [Eubacterium barkeri]|uniref:VanZ like family protein n=1 Tax=Eubacterium barkeri TaxID=1528 RepID=A0A1H3CNS6_EUBBA|nr:VanZ family protein [Eubacterium barkeri]SDX55766.1 VanZ like family protein [Eubacterium barkeri]
MKLEQKAWGLIAVAWMLIIFGFSAQDAAASSEMSDGIVNGVVHIIIGLSKAILGISVSVDAGGLTFVIRKCAHGFLYFILGILICHGLSIGQRVNFKQGIGAVLICLIYAASDELHQRFSFGRSCELRDVCIDTFGALLGIMLYYFFKNRQLNKKTKE